MTAIFESFSVLNPKPVSSSFPLNKKAASMAALCSSPSSLRFNPLLKPRVCRVLASPFNGLSSTCLSLHRRSSVVALAASHEESKHSEIEVEKEKDSVKLGADESKEAWKQALAHFKEQALKLQSVSQEAYEIYSKKALVILKETSVQLKIQAEKARHDLSEAAKEINEDGKEYLSTAAKNSPEPVREIVDTFTSSADDLNDISRVHDFYLGIPYGLVLSVGGFLNFMLTGSISALRFGVILGVTLLGLSISSLRAYRRGESVPLSLKGQTAIASVIFLRELRLLSQRPSFLSVITTFVSGAVVAFYVYRIILKGKQERGPQFENEAENQ
ncbi:hypothetical protein FEM48_Zijuj11G0124500 [Ziziphus jujuba var. spinosa]|uniref:Protein FATTY ACID EXPORT 3, chloroplastic n=1 Tax=Ziziphus jujuba var. spinosa TaxID=714518 RepID=A0A978UIX7_ZIZJJ|nr:hypothetical protein FEM48_Zijuj11G0124500 [Ziziphus jujuba var. spinosa]